MSKDEKIKELTLRSMEQDRQKLLMRQPFIGMILMHLDFVPITSGCRTACTDGSRVFMNCKFYAQLDLEERLFVLAHETWHCILLHFARLQNRNPEKFNIATDLEIHFILQKEKMKEPFVLPHDPDWDGLSAEEIYEKLGKSKKRPPDPGCCSKGFEGICEEGKGFDGHIYKNGSGTEGAAEEINAGGAGETDPDFAPQVDPQSVEKMRQIIIQSAQTIERSQKCLPEHMQRIVEKLRKPELNWKELLKQFVTSCYGGSRRWLPPARRYVGMGLYLQSRRNEKLNNVVVALDTSGSMQWALSQIFSELVSLLRTFGSYDLYVLQCDTAITSVHHFNESNPFNEKYFPLVTVTGGNCFMPVFNYIQKNRINPHLLIYLTDGYICTDDVTPPPSQAPVYPVIWALTKNGKAPVEWGKIIRLQGE